MKQSVIYFHGTLGLLEGMMKEYMENKRLVRELEVKHEGVVLTERQKRILAEAQEREDRKHNADYRYGWDEGNRV